MEKVKKEIWHGIVCVILLSLIWVGYIICIRRMPAMQDDFTWVYQAEDIYSKDEMFCIKGFAFELEKDMKFKNAEVWLREMETGKYIYPEMEYENREDVNKYFLCEYDYTRSGFIAKVKLSKLDLKGKEYMILLKVKGKSRPYETDIYISNEKLVYTNPKTFNAPDVKGTNLEDVVEEGILRVYRPDYGIYVYQYKKELYWITDTMYPFKDGNTRMQYLLYTGQTDRLPGEIKKGGWDYDNRGFSFTSHELNEQNNGKYRVAKYQLPTEYSIENICTGLYREGVWEWKQMFRPYYEFGNLIDELPEVGTIELFELYDESGGEWWMNVEDCSEFAWGQGLNVWNAYITVYEATNDEKWLLKMSQQIDYILSKRDTYEGKKDLYGNTLPAWSITGDSSIYSGYHFTTDAGMILYPILRFVEVVREEKITELSAKADEYFEACIDALSIFDKDICDLNTRKMVSSEDCYNLWREETIDGKVQGYYVGHLYYELDEFAQKGYVPDNMLPYNQCLALVQCYPVLYRLTEDEVFLEKTEKVWNWFEAGIQKDEIWWWYYSKYYDWNRENKKLMSGLEVPEDTLYFYEDYDGHYSVDLMFMIEANKIGVLNTEELKEISRNKMEMGLSDSGWRYIMNGSSKEENNLKAAVYFDYFVVELNESEYCDVVFPVLKAEIEKQWQQGKLADMSTKNNGTCLRLLASSVMVDANADIEIDGNTN